MQQLFNKIKDHLWIQNTLVFGFFLILIFAVYRLDFYFFYWDEIEFFNDFVYKNYNFLVPHVEHFKPLFKIFYFLEYKLYGANFLYFHYTNLVVHALTGLVLWQVASRLLKSRVYGWIVSFLFVISPLHAAPMLSNFQICSMLNVLVFLLALLCLQIYLSDRKKQFLYGSFLLTFVQTYFFGVGLLLPLVTMLYYFFFSENKLKDKWTILASYGLIFVVNIAIYIQFAADKATETTQTLGITDLPRILKYIAYALSMNLVRSLSLVNTSWIAIVLVFTFLLLAFYLLKKQKINGLNKTTLFLASFYFFIFVLISMARFRYSVLQSFAERYVYYHYIPVALFLGYFFCHMAKTKYRLYTNSLIGLYMIYCFSLFVYQVDIIKEYKQKIFLNNYVELLFYIEDSSYEPHFVDLHPFHPAEKIKTLYLDLIGVPIEDDINYQHLLELSAEE